MTTHLYLRVWRTFDEQIRAEIIRPGAKLPSLRTVARMFRVSVSTAVRAFLWLEAGGKIEARPRSGFYVSDRRLESATEPRAVTRSAKPTPIDVTRAITDVGERAKAMRVSSESGAVRTGLLPCPRLAQIARHIARTRPVDCVENGPSIGAVELRAAVAKRALRTGYRLVSPVR